MKNIAIFASGSGSNAENIIRYFSNEKCARVTLVLTNRPDAYVLERAGKLSVKSKIFDRNDFYASNRVLDILREEKIDFIVLAGFLWLVPAIIIDTFRNRLVNIHPALLPLYGGKGMYGARVHKAVIDNGESWSGITIHSVNEIYDDGDIIFQARCKVEPEDNADSLAEKIHLLEYEHYPVVIKDLIEKL